MDWRWTDSLGVALRGRGLAGRTTDLARAAERAGVGSLWVIEDYFDPGAYALAAAAAAATERIVIGLGVVNPYTRHPALIAMETAALAGSAPSRVVLWLCSSHPKWTEEHMSIPLQTTLRRLPVAVSDARAQARAWVRPLIAHYLGVLHGQSILADAGLDPARTQPFRDALAAGRAATDLVTDDLVDTFAVAGTPTDCRAALARWAEAGLDAAIAVVPERADLARQLDRLGRELAPAWKEMRCR